MSRTSRERYSALRQSAWRHPRIRSLSKGARSLFFMGLSYVPDFESDGLIPSSAVPLMDGTKREASELVSAGLWSADPVGYRVKSYLEHNASREELESIRSKRRVAGAKGGRGKSLASATANAQANATAVASLGLAQCESKPLPESESESESDDHDDQASPESAPASAQEHVATLLALRPNGRVAWKLLEALSQLHTPPGTATPVVIPGWSPSANDLTKLDRVAQGLGPDALNIMAAEWLALLSLIHAGAVEPPRGPVVAYFVACLAHPGQLDARCREMGVSHLPAHGAVA